MYHLGLYDISMLCHVRSEAFFTVQSILKGPFGQEIYLNSLVVCISIIAK